MGGGMGIAQGGPGCGLRIVTERTRMAMPEVNIGLFPDVGGSHFLSHAPGRLGFYLGLTGSTIGAERQGNPFLRFLWCEATAHAVRRDPELPRFYRRKVLQKGFAKARVAAARKLGIRLWIMLRDQIDYTEFCRRGLARQS